MVTVSIDPVDERAIKVCNEYGNKFQVLAATPEQILVKSLDGEWQGVFHRGIEAIWPDLKELQ